MASSGGLELTQIWVLDDDVALDKDMLLGTSGYVAKPVTIDELERALQLALRNH